MTEVYFSFDTEDFTSNHASDAVRDEANILSEYGVRGNFNIVGYLAREFVRYRRTDVLDALSKHTISFHSLRHSYHPTICEYSDIEDYQTARNELEQQECEGIGMVKATLGVDTLPAACPPGNSFSYVAMYAYADHNLPLYVGSLFETPDGSGVYYCNGFHTNYDVCMELFFYNENFDVKSFVDMLAEKRRVFVFNHPNRILYADFWDQFNYKGENINPMYQWEEAPRLTRAETDLYFRHLRQLLEALKADPRFKICTAEDLQEKALANIYGRTVTRQQLPAIRAALQNAFRWVDAPVSLSVADCFFAARHFLLHPEEDSYRPGKVHGFLYAPVGTEKDLTLTKDEICRLAEGCAPEDFLPSFFETAEGIIGPADLLFAMLDAAMGQEIVTVQPKAQQCDYEARYPTLKNIRLKNTWIHADSFEDRWMSDRLRLQAWTLRPEEVD